MDVDRIIQGDALDVLRGLPDACVDAVVTDPPAGIAFMGKDWDAFRRRHNPADVGRENVFGRTSRTSPHSYGESDRGYFIETMQAIFAEALRVVKPGGHALVWALPRTSHWTAMALEDAGWEIRDRIAAMNGQGFPKSLDPEKAAKKSGLVCQCRTSGVQYPTREAHGDGQEDASDGEDLRGLRQGVATVDALSGSAQHDMLTGMQQPSPKPATQGRAPASRSHMPILRQSLPAQVTARALEGEALQHTMFGITPPAGGGGTRTPAPNSLIGARGLDGEQPQDLSREDEWSEESSVEGWHDAQARTRQLSGRQVRSVSAGLPVNGTSRRLHHGASAGDGAEVRAPLDPRGSGASHRPQSRKQQPRQSGTLPEQRSPQTCGRCGLPIWPYQPGELGTALKPAVEDWWLCRKPLSEPTVAANVLRWGVGALNIDGCRIESQGRPALQGLAIGYGGEGHSRHIGTTDLGRWPAHLVLDEEAAALLDAQSGTLTSGTRQHQPGEQVEPGAAYNLVRDGGMRRTRFTRHEGDTGGASRFFYVAKASRSERNAGCEALPQKSWLQDGDPANWNLEPGTDRARLLTKPKGNSHPTVKPIALMRWLVRLITPPGGTVLDCFAGSGSTLVACVEEGAHFLGIEREAEYIAIAEARVAHAAKVPLVATPRVPAQLTARKTRRESHEAKQANLWDDVAA